jgi:putative endonuclease
MAKTARRSSGDEAEQRVVELLEREGWLIRDRNMTYQLGELDVVAEKGDVLAFVEVRMRASSVWGDPSATVSRAKQRKVVLAAMQYVQQRRLHQRAIRFDVASVIGRGPDAQVELIPHAFEAGF